MRKIEKVLSAFPTTREEGNKTTRQHGNTTTGQQEKKTTRQEQLVKKITRHREKARQLDSKTRHHNTK